MAADIVISASKIAHWKSEKEQLEREIAERQRKVADLAKKLEAANILAGDGDPNTLLIEIKPDSPDTEAPGESMISAVERIANASAAPITKKELKRQLALLGFSKERLAGYFYTPVMRLKDKKRITVLQDGKIWKAPS